MFVMAAVLAEVNKDIYKSWYLMSVYIPSSKVRYVLGFFGNMLAMNYFGILFAALTVERTVWLLN